MTTKLEIIAQLKKDYPVIKIGSDEAGYSELSKDEYEAKINEWAENIEAANVEPTITEKLASVGLDVNDLKAALGL